MPDVTREEPFCAEGSACFRLGTDDQGNAYLTDSHEALRTMILDIKAGKADHLL